MGILDIFGAAVFEVVEDGVHADTGEASARPAETVREVDWHGVVGGNGPLLYIREWRLGQICGMLELWSGGKR